MPEGSIHISRPDKGIVDPRNRQSEERGQQPASGCSTSPRWSDSDCGHPIGANRGSNMMPSWPSSRWPF
jgi:hypothetical protein